MILTGGYYSSFEKIAMTHEPARFSVEVLEQGDSLKS